MISSPFSDRLSAFDGVSGSALMSFKLDGERPPRADIPKWRINRSNARSAGLKTFLHTKPCRLCGGLVRLTHRFYADTKINKCAGCC